MSKASRLCMCLALLLAPLRSQCEDEITVGRSLAGLLKIDIEFDMPLEIPVSIFPGITGYAEGEMGFHSALFDNPDDDFYQLSTAADFRFILLAKDPGMEVWNDTGSAFMTIGELFYIGPSPFDIHAVWNIVTGTPGSIYSVTLKLRDVNGIYPDSEPFVVSFTPELPSGPFNLNISPTGAEQATVSWPTNAIGWTLQAAAELTASNWDTITNTPSIVGTNYSITFSTSGESQYFRLSKY